MSGGPVSLFRRADVLLLLVFYDFPHNAMGGTAVCDCVKLSICSKYCYLVNPEWRPKFMKM